LLGWWTTNWRSTNKLIYESDPHPGQHTKARSLSTGFSLVNGEVDDAEKPIRRRQKSDAEFSTREGNSGGVLMKAGPGLALRPKSGSRPEINNSQQDLVATAVPSYGDGLQAVRKSSSTPEFQDSDNSIASVWLKSKWNLKPDAFTLPLPILLLDSIPKPIFDTFPKQIAAWRNKAARD
jgi:hypothetical protein